MKIFFIALLVALFACSVSAYISNVQYTAKAFLSAKYVDPESASDNNGFGLFKYNAKTRTLNFHVTSSLTSVGHVSINGPISCYNRQTGGYFPQDSKECASNTGELVAKLGRGVAPDPKLAEEEGDFGFQVFKGDVVLSLLEEGMLFRNELNVLINTVTIDPETNKLSKETPGVRGQIYMSGFDSNSLEASLIFENNKGEFGPAKTKTANSGFGFVRHNPETNNDNNKRLQVYIISSASQPGNYILKCPTGIKIIGSGDNPLNTNVDFDDNQLPLLLDLFLTKSCYIFITTAAAPDGDIFSYFSPSAHFITTSLGSNEDPEVSSPYLAFSMANFDAADKTLDILTKHNITSNITSAHVEAKDGTVYCNLTTNQAALPIRSFCRLNASYIGELEDGKLFINIKTEANPLGELRGPLTPTVKSSSLMRSSSGSSGSAAVGLGVGLGIGIPLFILAGAAIFFLVKKGTIKF